MGLRTERAGNFYFLVSCIWNADSRVLESDKGRNKWLQLLAYSETNIYISNSDNQFSSDSFWLYYYIFLKGWKSQNLCQLRFSKSLVAREPKRAAESYLHEDEILYYNFRLFYHPFPAALPYFCSNVHFISNLCMAVDCRIEPNPCHVLHAKRGDL